MPSTLDPGDRKLLIIAGAILLFLIVATVVLAPSADDAGGQGVPTTYSTAKNGAQAAYLLLSELGYRSERWEKSPIELPSDADGKILILAAPSDFPDKKERDALLAFVRSGGWIVYAGNFPFLFLENGAVAPPSFQQASSLTAEAFPAIAAEPTHPWRIENHDECEQSLGRPRWPSSSTLRRSRSARGCNLAARKGTHPLVGRCHACHERGHFAGWELALFPELHSSGPPQCQSW